MDRETDGQMDTEAAGFMGLKDEHIQRGTQIVRLMNAQIVNERRCKYR